jgi:gas vesicle protein
MITKDKFRIPYLLVGMGLGAVAGLLLAPGAVEQMWKYLRDQSQRGLDTLNKRAEKLRESAAAIIKNGKEFIGPPQDSAKNTQEAERQTYEEQKREHPGG